MKEDSSSIAITTAVVVAAAATTLLATRSFRKQEEDTDEAAKKSRAQAAAETWESHIAEPHGKLQKVADSLYVLEASGTGNGPPVRNMTIYVVPDDSKRLVIFNGIAVHDETMNEILALGTPSVLVVPNCYHRCCAAVYKAKFPEIEVVCPEAAREEATKVVDVSFTTEQWNTMPEWSKWVQCKNIDGWADFESFIELKLSNSKKAVLVCDLFFTIPYKHSAGSVEKFFIWMFDSCIELPPNDQVIVPKIARLSRIFGIKDWAKACKWFRDYSRDHGKSVAAIVVGHGVPVVEKNTQDGCTVAFEGIADQLVKPRW